MASEEVPEAAIEINVRGVAEVKAEALREAADALETQAVWKWLDEPAAAAWLRRRAEAIQDTAGEWERKLAALMEDG